MIIGQAPIQKLVNHLEGQYSKLFQDEGISRSIDELVDHALVHASMACSSVSVAIQDIARISKSFTDRFTHSKNLVPIDLYVTTSAFLRLCDMKKPACFMRSCADFILTYIINSPHVDIDNSKSSRVQVSSLYIALSSNNTAVATQRLRAYQEAFNSPTDLSAHEDQLTSMQSLSNSNPFMAPYRILNKISSLQSNTVKNKIIKLIFMAVKGLHTRYSKDQFSLLTLHSVQKCDIYLQRLISLVQNQFRGILSNSAEVVDLDLVNELLLFIGLATSEMLILDISNLASSFLDSHNIFMRKFFGNFHILKDKNTPPSEITGHLQFLADRFSKFITPDLHDRELHEEMRVCEQQWQQQIEESDLAALEVIEELLGNDTPVEPKPDLSLFRVSLTVKDKETRNILGRQILLSQLARLQCAKKTDLQSSEGTQLAPNRSTALVRSEDARGLEPSIEYHSNREQAYTSTLPATAPVQRIKQENEQSSFVVPSLNRHNIIQQGSSLGLFPHSDSGRLHPTSGVVGAEQSDTYQHHDIPSKRARVSPSGHWGPGLLSSSHKNMDSEGSSTAFSKLT